MLTIHKVDNSIVSNFWLIASQHTSIIYSSHYNKSNWHAAPNW